MARAGSDHQLKARPVTIYCFEVLQQDGPDLKVRIGCSKGTYIRSLAHDLGLSLGIRAHLAALRRTKIGQFEVSQALTPEAWQQLLRPETL
jgi:tRNA pseudouridine55 synthase